MTDKTPGTITQPTALRMREAVRTCLDAERRRRAKLKDGAPASTYCGRRIAELEAALAQADAEAAAPPPSQPPGDRALRQALEAMAAETEQEWTAVGNERESRWVTRPTRHALKARAALAAADVGHAA